MKNKLEQMVKSADMMKGAFIACLIYWLYLFFTSSMSVRYDAIGYESLGQMIYKKGWIEFLANGPQREPLYPMTIAFSLWLADLTSISYQWYQKAIQICALLLSQILLIILMRKLNIRKSIQALAVLYLGLSPAMINGTFSLFSEIIVVPVILGIILVSARLWRALQSGRNTQVALNSLLLAFLFLSATSVKALFNYIGYAYLLPFIWVFSLSLVRKNRKIVLSALLMLIVFCALFGAGLHWYKSMNLKHNGKYTVANRGPELLFAYTYRRSDTLSPRFLMAYIASIPGEGVCRRFFTDEECRVPTFLGGMNYKGSLMRELIADTPASEVDGKIVHLSLQRMLQKPFQNALMMGIEGARMFFWESTKIGYVHYPPMVNWLYSTHIMHNGLRLVMSLLTIFTLGWIIQLLIRKKFKSEGHSNPREGLLICFFMLSMISVYVVFYSLFTVVTRYAIPLAPLFLAGIAYYFENILDCHKKSI